MTYQVDIAAPVQFLLRAGTLADLAILADIDNDAGELFEQAGLFLDLPPDHEFHLTEQRQWSECLAAGGTLIATEPAGAAIGFIAIGQRDNTPYVQQLSVRRNSMRKGVGSALLAAAGRIARSCGADSLWLTTYGHLSFNRPFYERNGFAVVPVEGCGAQIAQTVEFERRWLPLPHERVVMRRSLAAALANTREWRAI